MGVTLLTLAFGGVAAAGFVGLCSLVGRRFLRRGGLLAVAGGAVALTGLLLVPVVGFLASIGIGSLALGAAVGAPFGDRSTAGPPRVPASSTG
jgi:hypothetical protein